MLADNWGATAAERAAPLPCDDLLPGAQTVLHRAIDVDAPGAVVFRWLCQLRAAPYSYDALDNFGRRSPRTLTPGLGDLVPGQRFMSIFRLHSFAQEDHITLRSANTAVTYAVRPRRIVVRIRFRSRLPLVGRALAVGDLIMMRKQLMTLRDLSLSAGSPTASGAGTCSPA